MQQPPQSFTVTPAAQWSLSEDFRPPTEPSYRHEAGETSPTDGGVDPHPQDWVRNGQRIWLYVIIALLVWAVFGQTLGHDFVNYDDQNYVYENQRIIDGLTTSGVIAAFTQPHAQNWHPVTTISHMLDCQLFGLNPAAHHLMNVLFHAFAVLLLFAVLNAMTGAMWRSAFVAAVFAIHPLRVESVAWVAERKDVLSGALFMLTIAAYLNYVRDRRLSRYLAVVVLFALALMAKPMVVTLPLLLLLLDYWPLSRIQNQEKWSSPARSGIIREKIPLLFLSLAMSIVTLLVQRQTVDYSQALPLTGRLSNAVASYVAYLWQMIWPTQLAVFYPDAADRLPPLTTAFFALLLIGITGFVFWMRRKRKYLWVGWCWYLIALLPVIGIVQVGMQGRADRYTYLPQIGLYIAATWGVTELPALRSRTWARVATSVAAILVVGALAWCATIQASIWKNTESLWNHALAVTDDNDVAHNNMAALLLRRGRIDDAIGHYNAALHAGSRAETHNHLSPAIVENSLGNALARKGNLDEAIIHYRNALKLRPGFVDAHSNLSAMLLRKGDLAQAISEYEQVVATPPEDGQSHQRLAALLVKADRPKDAIVHYRRALDLIPDSVDNLNALAWILATSTDPAIKNSDEALGLAQRAIRLTGDKDPVVQRIIAASYAGLGRFEQAVAAAEYALSLAHDNESLSRSLEGEIRRYRDAARSKPSDSQFR